MRTVYVDNLTAEQAHRLAHLPHHHSGVYVVEQHADSITFKVENDEAYAYLYRQL